MTKNRFTHVNDSDFHRAMEFAHAHRRIVAPHHMLQKLIIFEMVAPAVIESKASRILEVGCGIGIHSAMLTKFGDVSSTDLAAPGSFVGADAVVDQVRASVFRELGVRPVAFKYNDGSRLDYPDHSFDLVFHNSVIEHVPDVEAFNREVFRILRPGGTCICITGTPALCNFRLARHWAITAPTQLAAFAVREFVPQPAIRLLGRIARRVGVADAKLSKLFDRLQPLTDRLDGILAAEPTEYQPLPPNVQVPDLHARLFHFLYFPRYNRLVIERIAASLGTTVRQVLVAARSHFASMSNRMAFALSPVTHGQHYRDVAHEREEWAVSRWRRSFDHAGYAAAQIYGYRYHHLLEWTPSYRWDSALYYLAVPWIRRHAHDSRKATEWASEIVIVARRPDACEPA